MVEDDWLKADRPQALLHHRLFPAFKNGHTAARMARLMAAGVGTLFLRYRLTFVPWTEEQGHMMRAGVRLAEALADDRITWKEADLTFKDQFRKNMVHGLLRQDPAESLRLYTQGMFADPLGCVAIRDVAGNPYRQPFVETILYLKVLEGHALEQVQIHPDWLTRDVRAVAAVVYNENRWDEVGLLADALEDAGCVGPLLDHLHEPDHVKGCWVVDAILGHRKS